MAQSARDFFSADVGIGITGLVTEPTPTSGPLGTAYVGYAVDGGTTSSISGRYPTRRLRIRSRAVTHALLGLIDRLRK